MATRRRQYGSWSDEAEELRVGLVAAAVVLGLGLLVAALIVPDDWSLVAIPGALLLGAALVVLAIVAWRGRRARAALEDASAERAIALVLAVIAAGAAVAVVAVALARDDVDPADLADVLWPLVVLIFGLLAVAALLLWRRPAARAGHVDQADADTLAGPTVSGAPAVADGVRRELGDARVQLQARAALLGEPVLPSEPSLALARFLQGPLVEALATVRSGLLAAYAVAVAHPQSQERIATVNRLLEHQATLAQALPARLDDVARRRSNVEGAWAAWEAAARDVTGLVVEASRFLDRVWAGQPEPGEHQPAPSPPARS